VADAMKAAGQYMQQEAAHMNSSVLKLIVL